MLPYCYLMWHPSAEYPHRNFAVRDECAAIQMRYVPSLRITLGHMPVLTNSYNEYPMQTANRNQGFGLMALFCAPFIAGCASTSNYDLGMYGTPTPALIMYASQVKQAREVCHPAVKKEESDRFYTFALVRGLTLEYYREKIPSFKIQEDDFLKQYATAWGKMSQDQQVQFCTAYENDVIASKDKWFLPIVRDAVNFRKFFSPVDEERLRHAEMARVASGVLSLGFTAAGVVQTNKQNFSTAGQFNATGGKFATIFTESQDRAATSTAQTIDIKSLPCEYYAPFVGMNQNLTADYFFNYFSIAKCPSA